MNDGQRALISEADQARIAEAIAAAERNTSGEIVAIVARESASYLSVPFMVGALVALAVPWPLVFFTWISVVTIYAVQLAVFVAVATVMMWPPIRMRLVPRSIQKQRAHRRAVEQFLAQNLHTVGSRTGVMIFVSFAERYAEIIADAGIHAKVPEATWDAMVADMTRRLGDNRIAEAFIGAIEATGALLAEHFPAGTEVPHEMPNHLIVLDCFTKIALRARFEAFAAMARHAIALRHRSSEESPWRPPLSATGTASG
jgi:putative membrane protein